MNGPRDQYTREMYDKFDYLAIWVPNVKLKLGDIGILNHHEFEYMTNLDKLDIDFDFSVRQGEKGKYIHSSRDAVDVQIKSAGQAPLEAGLLTQAEAGIIIKFTQENAVYFRADGAQVHTIDDQHGLGKEIIELDKFGRWEKDYAVVTELIIADTSTILISSNRDAHIEFRVGADFNPVGFELASVLAKSNMISARNIQTQIIAGRGLTPLFKARKVVRTFWGGKKFRDGDNYSFEELNYDDVS